MDGGRSFNELGTGIQARQQDEIEASQKKQRAK